MRQFALVIRTDLDHGIEVVDVTIRGANEQYQSVDPDDMLMHTVCDVGKPFNDAPGSIQRNVNDIRFPRPETTPRSFFNRIQSFWLS